MRNRPTSGDGRANAVRGKRALVEERHASLGRPGAQRPRAARPADVRLVSQLRAAEERDQQRVGPQLGRPLERPPTSADAASATAAIHVGDAAEIPVLTEDEARHGEPGLELCARRTCEPVRASRTMISTPAKPIRLARRKSSASSALGSTSAHDRRAAVHRSTGAPPSFGRPAGGERQLERQHVVAGGVVRLAILGDRSHELAHRAGETLVVPGAFEENAVVRPSRSSLDSLGSEQDVFPNRPIAAVNQNGLSWGQCAPVWLRITAPGRLMLDRDPSAPRLTWWRAAPELDSRGSRWPVLPVQPAAADVDPVHAVVIEEEVFDPPKMLEDETQLGVRGAHSRNASDRAPLDEEWSTCARPAPVLAHRQLEAGGLPRRRVHGRSRRRVPEVFK